MPHSSPISVSAGSTLGTAAGVMANWLVKSVCDELELPKVVGVALGGLAAGLVHQPVAAATTALVATAMLDPVTVVAAPFTASATAAAHGVVHVLDGLDSI